MKVRFANNTLGRYRLLILLFIVVIFGCLYFRDVHILQIAEISQKEDFFMCDCHGENFCFPSYFNGKLYRYGQAMDCKNRKLLDEYRLTDSHPVPSTLPINSSDVVIVTYASSNHWFELRFLLNNVRKVMRNKIVFYDLGLNMGMIEELSTMCNIEFRSMEWEKYPQFTRQLMTYQFKAIIMAEAFSEFDSFWLVDSSVQFKQGDLTPFYRSIDQGKVDTVVFRYPTDHGIAAATNPKTFSFLPLYPTLHFEEMKMAGNVFVHRSEFARNIVKWHFLCALTEHCMSPPNADLSCYRSRDHYREYMSCHRFDQSSLNTILQNMRQHPTFMKKNDPLSDNVQKPYNRIWRERYFEQLPTNCDVNE